MFRIEKIKNSNTWVVKDCNDAGYLNEDVWYLTTVGLECLRDDITAALQDNDLQTKGETQ